jgi:uncharacterized membrane protein YqhA
MIRAGGTPVPESTPKESQPDARPKRRWPKFLSSGSLKNWKIEETFEKFLWSSRFLVLFAVLASLAAALCLFFIGTFDIVKVFVDLGGWALGFNGKQDLHVEVIGTIIGSVDVFLIAVVLLIFSFGLYELFISHIDPADSHEASGILDIPSLDALKDKIGQVIVMALIVKFFQVVLSMKIESWTDMIFFGGAILLLATALFLMHWGKTHKDRSHQKE